jgi:hypothetical protein
MGQTSIESIHKTLQEVREKGGDVSLKSFIADTWEGVDIAKFYMERGIDFTGMTVNKILSTPGDNRFLMPEIIRDAVVRGLEYTPIHPGLIATSESIEGTGLTMPHIDWTGIDREDVQLRDVNEGATIPEGQIVTWNQKQVTISKKGRGLKQTYESIMWTPIDLAVIYFQELGTQLGADLDRDFVNILLNGDQADGSESAPVIGVTNAGTLVYEDLVRGWVRFRRIGRNSSAMLVNEVDAIKILTMDEFQKTQPNNAVSSSGIELKVSTPLPTSQDIFVHDAVPAKKVILVDRSRAVIQLTALPLLVETEKIISRQLQGEYVSIITGFANVFRDGRLVIDYATSLVTNPGPLVPTI